MDRQDIINEIKRTAEANSGSPLGTDRFFAETGIRRSDWFGKYWARWSDALVEAGYTPNTLQGSYDDGWVIGKLVSLIRELGRFPSDGDRRDFRWIFRCFSMAPGETIQLKYVEPARRENGGKGAKITRPHSSWRMRTYKFAQLYANL
jgi:hypothetical protein